MARGCCSGLVSVLGADASGPVPGPHGDLLLCEPSSGHPVHSPLWPQQSLSSLHISPGFVARAARPEEPGISVEYRDHWYFIPDSDHASKRTFALMQALFLSQIIEDSAQGAPVLTLPLN